MFTESLPRGKVLEIPFHQRKGKNFDAATKDCLSLVISKTQPWKKLTVYCCDHLNLDCPILPASLSNTLEEIQVIICKHFPGDSHVNEIITDDGYIWSLVDL